MMWGDKPSMTKLPNNYEEYPKKKTEDKLITIELDTLNDVPKVYYNGKQITNLIDINLQWKTDADEPGEKKFGISYFDRNLEVIKGIKEIKV